VTQKKNTHQDTPASLHAGIPEKLKTAGFSATAITALMDFDSAVFTWKHAVMKGELPRQLIATLNLDIEPQQFYYLTAILRIQTGIKRDKATEATIGLMAEELNVDPSRASRIAADLIAKDYLIREAAQDDGRKSIVVLTDKAKRVFSDFYDMKWSRYMEVFSEWDESEITTFSQLFNRYCSDFKRIGEKF